MAPAFTENDNMSHWQIAQRLIAAPIMGAAFVVFMPVIGFVMLGIFGVEKMIASLRKLRRKRTVTV